ncbi:MAG: hypothetical protein N2112_13910, partial [Gemmataceae bacterium]|nr:hypothetical protein [Gemmataceae bacterium]
YDCESSFFLIRLPLPLFFLSPAYPYPFLSLPCFAYVFSLCAVANRHRQKIKNSERQHFPEIFDDR